MTFLIRKLCFIALTIVIYSPAVMSQTVFEHDTEEKQNSSSETNPSSKRDKLIASVTVKDNPTLHYEDYGSHQVVFLSGESWGNEADQMAANRKMESLLKNKPAKMAISDLSSDDAVRLISNHDSYLRGIRKYLEKNKTKFFQESNENGEVKVNDMEWVKASSTPLIGKSVGFLDRSNIKEALFRD